MEHRKVIEDTTIAKSKIFSLINQLLSFIKSLTLHVSDAMYNNNTLSYQYYFTRT
jgi:hypothetical protein